MKKFFCITDPVFERHFIHGLCVFLIRHDSMFGKKRYAGKDVVVRKAADYEVDPGEGIIDGVVTALGEELIFENGVLVD